MAKDRTLISDFMTYLEVERNRSERTVKNYDFYLRRFFTWAQHVPPEKIDLDLVRKYRVWLNRAKDQHGRSMKKNTQNYHLIALRSFLKYLAKRDVKTLAPEKIELARMPERSVAFLDAPELERLLEAPLVGRKGEEPPSLLQLRDKAILEMLFSTGLRVSELAGLTREMVNLKQEEFTVRGKGDKPRVVFLSNQARHWLQLYLDRRGDVEPHLFVSHDRAANGREYDGGLTPRSIQRIVEHYARVAGITKRITPHTVRHTFATDLLRNGADIRSVQTLLGHSSITTTQIYTHITDERLREVYDAFHAKRRKR
ncbi:MAG TPA: site-specific tyrosine recombinase/integron integrase [Candidatus Binatia bacterium]|jgi:site-specific recombinase XerD|nr:site-specific tyrosine recombinase/integron integrase [Candidatus Binatia bacterium]